MSSYQRTRFDCARPFNSRAAAIEYMRALYSDGEIDDADDPQVEAYTNRAGVKRYKITLAR